MNACMCKNCSPYLYDGTKIPQYIWTTNTKEQTYVVVHKE